jgi:hypothetical protein
MAQSLDQTIQNLTGDAAKSYVDPMVSVFGANMNGAWFHQAPKAKLLDWDLEISLVVMASAFNNNEETFNVDGRFMFTREQARSLTTDYETQLPPAQYDALLDAITSQYFTVNIYGPTITGKQYDSNDLDNTAIHIGFPQTEVHYSVGSSDQVAQVNAMPIVLPVGGLLYDYPALPFVAPQITIGTLAGTKLSLRYLPDTQLSEEIGTLQYFGIGIQHNPAFWIPIPIPVDFSLSFFTQSLHVGDYATASATSYGLNVSKTFGPRLMSITPYAGISYETSNMEFKYTYLVDNSITSAPITSNIKFDVDGGNEARTTIGLSFRAALLNFNIDYNMAKYSSLTTGIGINFSW